MALKLTIFWSDIKFWIFFQKMLFNKGPPYEKVMISRCDIGCDILDVKDVESVTPLPVTSDVTSYLSHLQRTPWFPDRVRRDVFVQPFLAGHFETVSFEIVRVEKWHCVVVPIFF